DLCRWWSATRLDRRAGQPRPGADSRAPRLGGVRLRRAKPVRVNSVEITRTLVKSPPELWSELHGDRLEEAIGGRITASSEQERTLNWAGDGATGTVQLEPSSWGTKATLTAQVEEQVASFGRWE